MSTPLNLCFYLRPASNRWQDNPFASIIHPQYNADTNKGAHEPTAHTHYDPLLMDTRPEGYVVLHTRSFPFNLYKSESGIRIRTIRRSLRPLKMAIILNARSFLHSVPMPFPAILHRMVCMNVTLCSSCMCTHHTCICVASLCRHRVVTSSRKKTTDTKKNTKYTRTSCFPC